MDRIEDPRLKAIMEAAAPVHIKEYLRNFFAIDDPSPFKQLGTRAGFLERYPHEQEKLDAVLAGDRLLDFDLAGQLEEYFGVQDYGFLIRLQQNSYLAKKQA